MIDRIVKTDCRLPANANPQALRAVIYLKLELEGASKDAMDAILPKGIIFFTSSRIPAISRRFKCSLAPQRGPFHPVHEGHRRKAC